MTKGLILGLFMTKGGPQSQSIEGISTEIWDKLLKEVGPRERMNVSVHLCPLHLPPYL